MIALVRVAPPAGAGGAPVPIEVRLAPSPVPVAAKAPVAPPVAQLQPSTAPTAVPVAPSPATPTAPAAAPQPAAGPAHEASPAAADAASGAPGPAVPDAILTGAVDLTYYRARDLDVQPRAQQAIRPEYPDAADRQQLSGTVRLQLKLEADGRVSDVEVVNANPPGVFDDSAIKAFRDARFTPAQKAGRAVRALVVIEVVYDWAGRAR